MTIWNSTAARLSVLNFAVMRTLSFAFIATIIAASGCRGLPNGTSMDRGEALKVSDSFMSNLVADRVDIALDEMETQFVHGTGGKPKAEAALRSLFNYCGRPLESELRHEEIGTFLEADGRAAPMRSFYYPGTTTQNPKGVCFFAVKVVQTGNGMKVVSFGPLKSMAGQLPDWAR